MHQYLMPFVEAYSPEIASSVAPGVMEEQELDEFPEYSSIPTMYLAIRNICLTLWNLNFKVGTLEYSYINKIACV
jgi:hypothetical protein